MRDGCFIKLIKLKKKRENTLSFSSPEKDFFFVYICDVITWPGKEQRSTCHCSLSFSLSLSLSHTHTHTTQRLLTAAREDNILVYTY